MNNLKPMIMMMIMLTSILAGCTSSDTSELDQQIVDLQQSNNELTAQLELIEGDFALMNNITSELETSLTSANTTLDNLNNQLLQYELSINEIIIQRDSLQIDLDEAILSNSSIISSLESQVELLDMQIIQLSSNITEIQNQLDITEHTILTLTNSLNALSDSVTKLTYQLFNDIQGCSLNNPTQKLKIGFDDGTGPGSPDDGILQGPEVAMIFGDCSGNSGIVADISNSNPGISQLVEMGGILYFTADDGVHGNELWRSDGTVGGTWMVIDLSPPMCSTCTNPDSDIRELVAGDENLFFASNVMSNGAPDFIRELFVSDGTEDGTELVIDLFNCPTQSGNVVFDYDGVNSLLAIPGSSLGQNGQDKVIFSGFSCSMVNWVCFGEEVWMSDGSTVGTIEIANIRLGDTPFQTADGQGVMIDSVGSQPRNFFQSEDRIYFTADDNVSGREVWKVNLTQISSGATLIKNINSGSDDSINFGTVTEFTQIGEHIYFTADDGINGAELWKTNGFGLGTLLVSNIALNESSNPKHLTPVNDTLYFSADDGNNGEELWMSDGTESGTVMVIDINLGSSNPTQLTAVGNTLYFVANSGIYGAELWMSDGTSSGTVMVIDINSGTSGSDPTQFTVVDNTLYFVANGGQGAELWMSDGTESGTVMVIDINSGTSGSNPTQFTAVVDTLYFVANDGQGKELWYHSDNLEASIIF